MVMVGKMIPAFQKKQSTLQNVVLCFALISGTKQFSDLKCGVEFQQCRVEIYVGLKLNVFKNFFS